MARAGGATREDGSAGSSWSADLLGLLGRVNRDRRDVARRAVELALGRRVHPGELARLDLHDHEARAEALEILRAHPTVGGEVLGRGEPVEDRLAGDRIG